MFEAAHFTSRRQGAKQRPRVRSVLGAFAPWREFFSGPHDDGRGAGRGRLGLTIHGFSDEDIAQANRRLQTTGRKWTGEQVVDHLRSLER
jgi:hypothetical protein